MRVKVGAATAVLLLLLAGTPVTAPPRLLNLAALLDFANVAYQAYQRAIERLAQANVEWQTLRQGNGQPEPNRLPGIGR